MSKKKLAFYDAFRQKPDDATEFPADSVSNESSSSSKNLSSYSAYAPGEELSVRPRPKHIPTSHHAAGSQRIEVRAKGSSLAPGMAQKYQTPNVNRSYFPTDGIQQPKTNTNIYKAPEVIANTPPKTSFVQNKNIPLPPEEMEEPEITISVKPKVRYESEKVPVAKPVSSQSATMPYLEPEDLETQNIQVSAPKKSSSMQSKPVNSSESPLEEVIYQVTVPKAIIALIGVFCLMFLTFYIGISFHGENNNEKSMKVPQNSERKEELKALESYSNDRKLDQPIPPPKVEAEKPAPAVVNNTKTIIIRACTVESLDKAKALAEKLESSGISPTEIKQTRKGVLVIVGPFETASEASKMLKSLKFKSINGWKPFEDAYIVNN